MQTAGEFVPEKTRKKMDVDRLTVDNRNEHERYGNQKKSGDDEMVSRCCCVLLA